MLELIAIAFATETLAAQAAMELERRCDELGIDQDAIGVIICERDSSYQLITKRRPEATATWSKFWSRILEVFMDDRRDTEIDIGFRTQVREMLTPGTSVLMTVTADRQARNAIDALSHYGGSSVRCCLSEGGVAELHSVLNDGSEA